MGNIYFFDNDVSISDQDNITFDYFDLDKKDLESLREGNRSSHDSNIDDNS